MAIFLPNDVNYRRADLENHPTVWVGIQFAHSSKCRIDVLRNRHNFSVEKTYPVSQVELLPVQAIRAANLFSHFLVDFSFAHHQTSEQSSALNVPAARRVCKRKQEVALEPIVPRIGPH